MRFDRYVAFATAFAVVSVTSSPSIDSSDLPVDVTSSGNQSADSRESVREDRIDNILETMFFDFPLSSGGVGSGVVDGSRGWMARWLALGGEGEVVIRVSLRSGREEERLLT